MPKTPEGTETPHTFSDIVRLADEIIDRNILPRDSQQYYLNEAGILSLKMRDEDAAILYNEESIEQFADIQIQYHQVRAFAVSLFDEVASGDWNASEIGVTLRKIAELLLEYRTKIESKKTIYLASFFFVLKALENFVNLLADPTFESKSNTEKLKELNDGAKEFRDRMDAYARQQLVSSTIQIARAISETDESQFADIKQGMVKLYPMLQEVLRSSER